jgi:recombination protein RecA
MRMDVGRSATNDNSIWEGKKGESERLGNLHKVKIIKNKMAAPFRKAEFDIIYGEGIDKYTEIIKVGSELEIFKKYGESVTHEGTKYNVEDFKTLLKDNEEMYQDLRKQCLLKTGILPPITTETEPVYDKD